MVTRPAQLLNIQHWNHLTLAQKPEDGLKVEPACHPQACAIQDCIQKNNFKEERCQKQASTSPMPSLLVIDALYECCNLFYQRNGDEASVVSCPKAILLRLKMKQRSESVK
ncbi:hypothetical protein D0869_07808 [Hortaea werneckii]|uniref:Cx9C motif-containing protein 4, mitochondrial n=1 Tax=Hortaea werneckii TaxID=91943 RepID=A0A3M6WNL1_HORWE|nr:hypothetical protein D0869_07808 [Hortaea werneckii]